MQSEKECRGHRCFTPLHAPLRCMTHILVAVFAMEIAAMFLVLLIPKLPVVAGAFLDAVLITLGISPIVYLCAVRPLMVYAGELKKREIELLKLTTAVEQSPSVVMITDAEGDIQYVNPKFSHLTGYSREEAVGKNPRILKSGELADSVYKSLWEAVTLGKEWRGEFHNRKKNGELFWEGASISPVKNGDGRIIGFIKVAEDITSRKETENKLKSAQEELEKKNRELEKLDQLKSEFVSTVSHELRTPLSITKEGVSLVLDGIPGEVNEKQKRVLFTARDNIDRLARIINELLDISKIEAGRLELKRELVDICGLIRNTVSLFEPKIKQKQLELRLRLPDKAVTLYIDTDKMTQVFTNLISNAVKFTQRGFIEISAQSRNGEVEFIISDSGIGIAKEDLPKIFEKFQQFGRKVGPGEKGTGLGLSIVKGIIELHKGSIRVESALGQGTRFILSLPKYTSEMVFREYINDGIRDAVRRDAKMSLVVISVVDFEKTKQNLPEDKLRLLLRDMADVLQNSLRRKGDVVVRDTGEAIVILVDCTKECSLVVQGRLEEALENYLASQKLAGIVKLHLTAVTYPDEARSDEDLIKKAREAKK